MKRIMTAIAVASLAAALGAGATVAAPMAQNSAAASAAGVDQMAGVKALIQDARLQGMKAALKLTPDQQKYWDPFETAVRDSFKQRNEMMGSTRQAIAKDNPVQLLDTLSDDASRGAAQMKQVADAAKPLWENLDPSQRQAFGPLLLTLRSNPMKTARRQQRVTQQLMQRWAQSQGNNGD
ncbi:MAG: Spy/CpxP family protein refolding chaperone [Bradyrhizobium sp.]|uniref:Spy/CpxP family protein refolding chaperone n=1 Tax=Bradyrhizobium sp. TaxID=376 RepID=UPI001C283FFC|nr:Spy/CpxP family protein refolding chaperone [Bradyrhizobium sp.]MBU6463941.1 Spy/CpxP family protein refolding chaperone [Pseudomonadota bacterium]MDE2067514.1 Spy/CpxP family protein refolding chaperone [Bradyrhizobium sp.]MDE2241096.1 Spy/CpxP family protein refolding chaperone [Bradyrhizobium sp.]MDE2471381.1 Spy/CpxP family protein refolding chaperone [Bradyrhizobium sp.]